MKEYKADDFEIGEMVYLYRITKKGYRHALSPMRIIEKNKDNEGQYFRVECPGSFEEVDYFYWRFIKIKDMDLSRIEKLETIKILERMGLDATQLIDELFTWTVIGDNNRAKLK